MGDTCDVGESRYADLGYPHISKHNIFGGARKGGQRTSQPHELASTRNLPSEFHIFLLIRSRLTAREQVSNFQGLVAAIQDSTVHREDSSEDHKGPACRSPHKPVIGEQRVGAPDRKTGSRTYSLEFSGAFSAGVTAGKRAEVNGG